MLLTLTCLFTLSTAKQDLTKPVDYETRAKPTSAVLLDLSKKTGVEMFCTPDLDNEPLILKLNHVPLKNAMDKIAFVFAGEWKKHENGYQLQRSEEADKLHAQAQQDDINDYKAGVQQAIKQLGPYSDAVAQQQIKNFIIATPPGQPINIELYTEMQRQDPVARLLARILAKMDPKDVVDIPPSAERFFSNVPTSLEKPLPEDLSSELDQFEKDQDVLNSAVANSQASNDANIGMKLVLSSQSDKPIARILVSLAGARGRYNAGIFLADSTGRIIAHGGLDINGEADETQNIQAQKKIASTNQATVKLGPIASDILPNINNQENFHRVQEATRTTLLSPTTTDPLAIATSDIVLGIADKDNVNVVYLPPDDHDYWSYNIARTGKISLAALEQETAYGKELDVSEDNGWLIGAPLDPLRTAQERLSRPAMEQFLKDMQGQGGTPIDALARLEADAGPDSNKIVLSDALMALVNADFYALLPAPQTGAEPCLALLGTLADQERQKAVNDGLRISGNQLSDQQVAYLHEWLMGYGSRFLPIDQSKIDVDLWKTIDGQGLPSEVLDSAESSFLEVSDRSKPEFDLMYDTDQGRFGYGTDLDGLARLVAQQERPELFPDAARKHLESVKLGSSRDLTMRYVVGGCHQRVTYTQYFSPPKSSPGKPLNDILDQLPSDTRNAYTQALAKYRAGYLQKKPGG